MEKVHLSIAVLDLPYTFVLDLIADFLSLPSSVMLPSTRDVLTTPP